MNKRELKLYRMEYFPRQLKLVVKVNRELRMKTFECQFVLICICFLTIWNPLSCQNLGLTDQLRETDDWDNCLSLTKHEEFPHFKALSFSLKAMSPFCSVFKPLIEDALQKVYADNQNFTVTSQNISPISTVLMIWEEQRVFKPLWIQNHVLMF